MSGKPTERESTRIQEIFLPAATLGAVRSTGAKVWSAYIVLVEEVNYILICPDEVLLLVPPAPTQCGVRP